MFLWFSVLLTTPKIFLKIIFYFATTTSFIYFYFFILKHNITWLGKYTYYSVFFFLQDMKYEITLVWVNQEKTLFVMSFCYTQLFCSEGCDLLCCSANTLEQLTNFRMRANHCFLFNSIPVSFVKFIVTFVLFFCATLTFVQLRLVTEFATSSSVSQQI